MAENDIDIVLRIKRVGAAAFDQTKKGIKGVGDAASRAASRGLQAFGGALKRVAQIGLVGFSPSVRGYAPWGGLWGNMLGMWPSYK